MTKRPTLTTSVGAPIGDNQNSVTAGQHGPVLLQDYRLIETLAHQNRERIRGTHRPRQGLGRPAAHQRSPTTSPNLQRRRPSQRSARSGCSRVSLPSPASWALPTRSASRPFSTLPRAARDGCGISRVSLGCGRNGACSAGAAHIHAAIRVIGVALSWSLTRRLPGFWAARPSAAIGWSLCYYKNRRSVPLRL
jgi:hypothetical protein